MPPDETGQIPQKYVDAATKFGDALRGFRMPLVMETNIAGQCGQNSPIELQFGRRLQNRQTHFIVGVVVTFVFVPITVCLVMLVLQARLSPSTPSLAARTWDCLANALQSIPCRHLLGPRGLWWTTRMAKRVRMARCSYFYVQSASLALPLSLCCSGKSRH